MSLSLKRRSTTKAKASKPLRKRTKRGVKNFEKRKAETGRHQLSRMAESSVQTNLRRNMCTASPDSALHMALTKGQYKMSDAMFVTCSHHPPTHLSASRAVASGVSFVSSCNRTPQAAHQQVMPPHGHSIGRNYGDKDDGATIHRLTSSRATPPCMAEIRLENIESSTPAAGIQLWLRSSCRNARRISSPDSASATLGHQPERADWPVAGRQCELAPGCTLEFFGPWA